MTSDAASATPAAWIFQSNPDYYDLPAALAERDQLTWSVNQHASEIKQGDRVYLWESGKNAGVLALAHVLEGPRERGEELPDGKFYRTGARFDRDRLRALLQVDLVLPQRLPRKALLDDAVLREAKIIRLPNNTNYPLELQEQNRLEALLIQLGIEGNSEVEHVDLSIWQESINTHSDLVDRFVHQYPTWLATKFADRATFKTGIGGRFGLFTELGRIIFGELTPEYIRMWLLRSTPEITRLLRSKLSYQDSLVQIGSRRSSSLVFRITSNLDYAVLQEATAQLLAQQGFTGAQAGLKSQEQLRIALLEMLTRGGEASIAQIYDAIEGRMNGYKLSKQGKDSLRSLINRDAVSRGYVYPYDSSNPVWRITDTGRDWLTDDRPLLPITSGTPPIVVEDELPVVSEPLEFTPQLHAAPDASFWRFHIPKEVWAASRRAGVLGINPPPEGVSHSMQRLGRIRVGDRVVSYLKGARVGGIGVVTRARYDVRTAPEDGDDPFGGNYPLRIGVAWADAPAEPVELYQALTQPEHGELYNRLKNPQAVVPLDRDDYIELLGLLGVDDAGAPAEQSRLPELLNDLALALQFVQRTLELRVYRAGELTEVLRSFSDNAAIDADDWIEHLRQLRLLYAVDDLSYRPHDYTTGNPDALLRLAVLGWLAPVEGATDQYSLPVRAILPRLHSADSHQPPEAFAPELRSAGITLLDWYAQAGLVETSADGWRRADGALDPLPGDDPATLMYNRFLAALLVEASGKLQSDLEPASGPLPPVTDLAGRLRELGRELLVDERVVRRVYRSLMAGRHVVLSGPPGTGKTELARRLPSLLWREPEHTLTRLPETPDAPPVVEQRVARQGYAAVVVTATEDWGVRDVVGGIGPRLDGNQLGYTVQHGALTRVVLRHYANSDGGRKLPPLLLRRDYEAEGRRYRGAWLVIDEFTRAPVDAAFGGLLTTLGGGAEARLSVPTPAGDEVEVRLPEDFRIIATLNSFDRHFLNQISEALKRRFDFIDVPPPAPQIEQFEQGIAAKQALARLHAAGFSSAISIAGDPPAYRWDGAVAVIRDMNSDTQRYLLVGEGEAASQALNSFWRIFGAVRVFRQLGTAQAVAVYTNLFSGVLSAGMPWDEALDSALADSLADQLQVLARDEQQVLEVYLLHTADPVVFATSLAAILKQLPAGRQRGLLHALAEAERLRHGDSTIGDKASAEQLARVFALGTPLALPARGLFQARLRDLISERGL